MPIELSDLRRLAESAIAEDRAVDDLTTVALVPGDQMGRAVITAKAAGVIAGLPLCQAVFDVIDQSITFRSLVEEGSPVAPYARLALVEGRIGSILRAERVALNFLQHLCGVASATATVVEAIAGSRCRVRDTRKTLPGLRAIEKYAVRCGGGDNHRFDLADGVLVKDNHLAALHARGLALADAVALLRRADAPRTIQIEVTTVQEVVEALDAGADELLLDNMAVESMREAVGLAAVFAPRRVIEASGGIVAKNAGEVAETGVDFISVGAITHSAAAMDLSLELET